MPKAIYEERYVRLTTFTQNGRPKYVPVWIAYISDELVGFTTLQNAWKVKRIRHTPSVELIACNYSGTLLEDAKVMTGSARVVHGIEYQNVVKAIRAKYGWQYRMIAVTNKLRNFFRKGNFSSDCAVVIKID